MGAIRPTPPKQIKASPREGLEFMKKLQLIKDTLDVARWVAVPWAAYVLFIYCGWLTAYSVAGFGFYMLSWESSLRRDAVLAVLTGPLSWLCFTVQVWMVLSLQGEIREAQNVLNDPS